MREARFDLKTKSGAWTHHPTCWDEPDARMVECTLVALRGETPLGGHNIQAHVGSSTRYHGPPADVDMWLSSGWWVTLRNQFAQAPQVGAQILGSAEDELSRITGELETMRGPAMADAKDRLCTMTFHARGPDYSR